MIPSSTYMRVPHSRSIESCKKEPSTGVGILIPKIGISGSGLKKMESGRDGMGFSIPIFFGTGRDGVFRSRFFRDGTGLKKN